MSDWGDIGGGYTRSDHVTLTHDGTLVHVTDGAALVRIEGDDVWIPLSLIVEADADSVTVAEWWATKEGLY